jgi:carboxypeptidase PM20D1
MLLHTLLKRKNEMPHETKENSAYPDLPGKLSALIKFPSVSSYIPAEEDESAFASLVDALPGLYPRVNAAMTMGKPSTRSLLYTWKGKNPDLEPVVLCAHFDVVPALNGTTWKHGPFSGDIDSGELWGRGAQDVKVLMASMLEAAEHLIEKGFTPERTVYFAFGGDEEVGGNRGASAIAAALGRMGVRASFLLDEGGPISVGMLSFVKSPLALIGVAEKGYVDFELTAVGHGGHASMPPRRTAPGNLSRAIAALETHPSRAVLTKTVRAFLEHLSSRSAQPYRFLFKNLWLTAPFVKLAFGSAPTTSALIRTTTACTMLEGSSKENVLAETAKATLNVRILPSESVAGVMERLAKIVKPFDVKVSVKYVDHAVEPSDESDSDNEGWRAIESACAKAFPDAFCVPFLFSAGTDTKHYKNIVDSTYRFTALPQSGKDLERVHGDEERVRLRDLDRCAVFYRELMSSL